MSAQPQPPETGREVSSGEAIRLSRRAFAVWAVGGLGALTGWCSLRSLPTLENLPWPLRWMHQFNENLGRALFSPSRLAPEFPRASATEPRVNGNHGRPVPAKTPWRVVVEGPLGQMGNVTVEELMADLPRIEFTSEFKCIEGWSEVVNWGGVRLSDVAKKQGWPVMECSYVAMETPTGGYFVGLDMPSALHPQTLLCDQMNGEPLTADHGGPLRLIIPVKYGIKNLKWLAKIRFQNEQPADYWSERGYDWYAGL